MTFERDAAGVYPAMVTNGEESVARDGDALLVQVGLGSHDDFAAIYYMFGPSIYGLARRVIRDAHLAEEVMQEVFVTVWKHAPRFDPLRGSATNWVMTIAHRRSVDRVRSEEAFHRRTMLVHYDAIPLLAETDVRWCPNDQMSYEMIGALSALSMKQRQAIWLAFYEGLTYGEISKFLEIPLATTKTRIRDGLIALRMNSTLFERSGARASIRACR